MKRILCCLVTALLLPIFRAGADDGSVRLQFMGADVKDVLELYERWTGRKVWLTLDLRAALYFRAEGSLTKEEAIRFLRTALLEKYGIELRDSGEKEAFATWSEDPKYKAVRTARLKEQVSDQNPEKPPKPRVRVIEPKETQK